MEDTIQVVHNNKMVLVTLGEHGVELTRPEAEALFVSLGHTLKDMDIENVKSN